MNVAELVVGHLEKAGVKHIFYIPGGPLVPLTQAVWDSSIDFIYSGHECSAAYMAYGYAWQTGSLGVCCVTTGPGATNALTGIATAKLEGIPLLIITAMNATNSFSKKPAQDSTDEDGVDTVGIYRQVTHYSKMISSPEEAAQVIQNAIKIALIKQGPVHVSLPTNIGLQPIPEKQSVLDVPQYLPKLASVANKGEVEATVAALIEADNPLMFVGYDALAAKSSQQIFQLANSLAMPVMTTARAKGLFPEDHPLSLGVYGFASNLHPEVYLEKGFDVLLSVGVDFHENATENWSELLAPKDKMIQIHKDPTLYGHYYPGTIGLVGDIKETLNSLNEVVSKFPIFREKAQDRKRYLKEIKDNNPRMENAQKMFSNDSPIKPQRLIKDLQDSFPEDTIFVSDIGGAFLWASHFMTMKKPHNFLVSTRNAAMGFSVAGLGCKAASPEKPVVVIIGDGAMKMHGMEIAAAVTNKLPIVFVVLNDAKWGIVRFGHKLLNMKVDVSNFPEMDCAKIGEALGARGIKISKPGEINRELVEEILHKNETVVLDVYIDDQECPPFGSRIKGFRRHFDENTTLPSDNDAEIIQLEDQ